MFSPLEYSAISQIAQNASTYGTRYKRILSRKNIEKFRDKLENSWRIQQRIIVYGARSEKNVI